MGRSCEPKKLKNAEKVNSSKSFRWSAVPVAPMWVYVDVWWWEGQRPRRGRWPILSKFWGFRLWFEPWGCNLSLEAAIWASRLGLSLEWGGRMEKKEKEKEEKEEEKKKKEEFLLCESIGHRPLRGRCPKSAFLT